MASIFVSYKREDEVRAARLVRALEDEGLTVWWDRGLTGGDQWRQSIERALDDAKCVLVLWTFASTSQEGGFVRDEAARAQRRGLLVPVLLDRVEPPLGFGETQAIDLRHWRGSGRDPFFRDLVALISAKLEGRAPPRARGPIVRLYRRAAAGMGVTGALALALLSLSADLFGVQAHLCSAPLLQPAISDTCGWAGLGDRPTREERIAWQSRAPGSCEALRDIARDADHHYRDVAADLYSARVRLREEVYSAAPREAQGYVGGGLRPSPSQEEAQRDALRRAEQDARNVFCAPGSFERLDTVEITSLRYECRRDLRGGFVCAADYVAQCDLAVRREIERCD